MTDAKTMLFQTHDQDLGPRSRIRMRQMCKQLSWALGKPLKAFQWKLHQRSHFLCGCSHEKMIYGGWQGGHPAPFSFHFLPPTFLKWWIRTICHLRSHRWKQPQNLAFFIQSLLSSRSIALSSVHSLIIDQLICMWLYLNTLFGVSPTGVSAFQIQPQCFYILNQVILTSMLKYKGAG